MYAAKKMLTLKVRQEQRVDPESDYPQVTFFQMPVQIEIDTAINIRVERIQLAAKEEQSFTFPVESEPLLVNFDYGSTLIKELNFDKATGQLLYQLANDRDVLGRIWSMQQLAGRMNDGKTSRSDRQTIIKAIGDAAVKDGFWGARLEAATALNGVKEAKDWLLTATKDANARVRTRAVNSLAAIKDPLFAATYEQMLNDPSYATIRAAAQALGQTRSPQAYDALIKLIDTPSWRDTIRASGLAGLAALGDKRALELGIKYQGAPHPATVRGKALYLIVAAGKDDPRTFGLVTGALKEAYYTRNFGLMTSAAEALIALGDERGLSAFQDLRRKAAALPDIVEMFAEYEERLRARLAAEKPKS